MKLRDRIDDRVKIFLLYFYMAGLAFFVGGIGLGLGFFEMGVIIAVLNSFITEPLVANIKLGNKAKDVKEIARFRFAKNALMGILICYFIAWFHQVVLTQFFHFYLEPISFGLVYATIHLGIIKLLPKRKSGIKSEETQ